MQAFIVSVFAGCLFPLLPLFTEFGLTNDVAKDAWPITSVVYVIAVGLVSRHQAVSITSFFFAAICSVVYAADKYQEGHASAYFIRFSLEISTYSIILYSVLYIWERYDRHVTEGTPFLEFEP